MSKQNTQIELAINLLQQAKAIAFPTDTVYGLGADPSNEQAILSIYALKNRPLTQALPVLLPDLSHIYNWADQYHLSQHNLHDKIFKLLAAFWPGALTIVVKKANHVSNLLTANQDTIALRVPNHPLTLALLKKFNSAIIGSSANKSGQLSTINAKQVKKIFGEQLLVLDDDSDSCAIGMGSTIISLINHPIILREGAISMTQLQKYL